METPRPTVTFIVRVSRDAAGEVVGSVQRVRTGERRPFRRAETIGLLIAEMIAPGGAESPAPSALHDPGEEPSSLTVPSQEVPS